MEHSIVLLDFKAIKIVDEPACHFPIDREKLGILLILGKPSGAYELICKCNISARFTFQRCQVHHAVVAMKDRVIRI